MAGKFRRKFIAIISDKFTEHYQGKVADKELSEALQELGVLVSRLDSAMNSGKKNRAETLRKLKRLPLERLQEILSEEA